MFVISHVAVALPTYLPEVLLLRQHLLQLLDQGVHGNTSCPDTGAKGDLCLLPGLADYCDIAIAHTSHTGVEDQVNT